MLGNFQQSQLRIEVEASVTVIRGQFAPDSCSCNGFGQSLAQECQNNCIKDLRSLAGLDRSLFIIKWRWRPNCLRLVLSQGIDGFHEWYWGEGWVQSRLEGVSMPLNLGHNFTSATLFQF